MLHYTSNEINEYGYWQDNFGHHFDEVLSTSLCEFFTGNSVTDLGCGSGEYVRRFGKHGIQAKGYDGNPLTKWYNEDCEILNLAVDFKIDRSDWVLSLEVGEHIPEKYEQIYLNNVCKTCNKGLVVSWAIPGQGGHGHVNTKPNSYIIKQIEERGFVFDQEQTDKLRLGSSRAWFANTLMVFHKTTPRITFCITCRNRTEFLKKTIFHNLEVQQNCKHSINFTLLNYGSEDDLHEFVLSELRDSVNSGVIRYFRCDADTWHASKAKNLSHVAANGFILFNLDCDNLISAELCEEMIDIFDKNRNTIIFNADQPGKQFEEGGVLYNGNGTGGRIAITAKNFLTLGGYDENMLCMGYQDNDLICRGEAFGLQLVRLRKYADAYPHVKCLGVGFDLDEWRKMDELNKARSKRSIENRHLVVDTDFTRIAQQLQQIDF